MPNNIKTSRQPVSLKLSHEQWLAFGLTSTVLVILALVIALTYQLGWSLLATATLVFFLSYPLIWLAWRCYNFWRQAIMQLTTYTQVVREGETNLRFKGQHQDNLLAELQQEISALAIGNANKVQQNQTLENVLSHILDSWPIPVCLFDENNQLSYRNIAMKEKIQQPMLIGTAAEDLGFILENDNLTHSQFNQQWQCQSVSYLFQQKRCHIFSALDISQPLHQQQSITQQNIIRVLAHELRNSLTPMASMADTLLCNDSFNEEQVRMVLCRIKQRSERLLSFIEQYSQLSQLPAPKLSWFDFNDLLDEAKGMITEPCLINYQGTDQCFADVQQMAQILINIFKNAQEACQQEQCQIDICLYYQQENSQGFQQTKQVIEITDNGPGFANLDNALTPFYTTKSNGSGIGLSLCAEITRNHGGEFTLENTVDRGAKITMVWPVDNEAHQQ
ncbi:sensor histidine kinase [Colwellia psychrerythraea]|uniref:histidine kinase n=1 Tax=Colwellia psychrerythraea TaxID=28229 RepID=A0A099KNH5_COLPS|nr:HAMP domain-containing sensor histidine kinase [Colwellia psychrerythraea]KGJ91168.1 integral membrane sensor signal transduction histidine kinase [Colwellia psychrerythraea]